MAGVGSLPCCRSRSRAREYTPTEIESSEQEEQDQEGMQRKVARCRASTVIEISDDEDAACMSEVPAPPPTVADGCRGQGERRDCGNGIGNVSKVGEKNPSEPEGQKTVQENAPGRRQWQSSAVKPRSRGTCIAAAGTGVGTGGASSSSATSVMEPWLMKLRDRNAAMR
jgi:hypothetical protein